MSLESFLVTLARSGHEIDRLFLSLVSRDIRTHGPAQRKLLRGPAPEVEEGLLALLRVLDWTRDPFLMQEDLLDDRSLYGIIHFRSGRGQRRQWRRSLRSETGGTFTKKRHMSMRQRVGQQEIEQFLVQLSRTRQAGRLYLVGGAAIVYRCCFFLHYRRSLLRH